MDFGHRFATNRQKSVPKGLYAKGRLLSSAEYSTYRQKKGEESYDSSPFFLTSIDLIESNKREAKRLPYNRPIFYHRRGGVSPPAIFVIDLQSCFLVFLFVEAVGVQLVKIQEFRQRHIEGKGDAVERFRPRIFGVPPLP